MSERPTHERIEEIRAKIVDERRCVQRFGGFYILKPKEAEDLLAEIDALESALANANQRTERGDLWNAWVAACKQLDQAHSEIGALRAELRTIKERQGG
jgi:hypothetical protein